MEELEATLRGKMKELEKEFTDAEASKKSEKKLKASEVHGKNEKADLHGQIEEPDYKLIEKDSDKEKLETNLYVRIKELEKHLQGKDAEKEQLETAL